MDMQLGVMHRHVHTNVSPCACAKRQSVHDGSWHPESARSEPGAGGTGADKSRDEAKACRNELDQLKLSAYPARATHDAPIPVPPLIACE